MEKTDIHFRSQLARLLTESVMGFFALAALALAFAPELFDISPRVLRVFDVVEWLIVGVFAIEYAVNLTLAEQKQQYVLNPWRLLDLGIVIAAMASALPQVTDDLRSSPILRVLRLLRAILFGARASGSITRRSTSAQLAETDTPAQVSLLRPIDQTPKPGDFNDLLATVRDPTTEQWCHAGRIYGSQLDELATAVGTAPAVLRSCLSDASYPRVEKIGPITGFFLRIPRHSGMDIERSGLLVLPVGRSLLTLSRQPTDLQEWTTQVLPSFEVPGADFTPRMLLGILRASVSGNTDAVGYLEGQVRALEDTMVPDSRADFFERTFRLRKQISAIRSDLWRLKGLLVTLIQGRAGPDAFKNVEADFLRALADEADYLHETVENLREALVSIIELHLNVASFEMNKVMRILAVASVLGLVPAVIGGLFGMNIEGNPWPLTLPQVTFAVSIGMLLCLYVFFAKGWLR
jgi:hypothetical protein